MKKLLSLCMALVMVVSMALGVSAKQVSLDDLAEETIEVSEDRQESGALVYTYEKIDVFIEKARMMFPTIEDVELAYFLLEFTGQSCEAAPEEEALLMLEYDNISISTSYIRVSETGCEEVDPSQEIATCDIFNSSDGYMQLETGFTKTGTTGSTKRFNVWTIATWLKYPEVCLQDVLVVGTNGSFDDSYDEFGYVRQVFTCLSCGQETVYKRDVDRTTMSNFDAWMEYTSGGIPAMKFVPLTPRCDYCGGTARDKVFRAFIRYGVLVEGSGMIQAAYGHKTLGPSDISVGVDANGMPSISVGWTSRITTYNARAVTLQ